MLASLIFDVILSIPAEQRTKPENYAVSAR
jgi:hypothetical protein